MIEKVISTQRIHEGKILNLRVDEVLLPNNKKAYREIIEHQGAVAIVAITDDGKILLVNQYRSAIGEVMTEIPAGKLENNEDPVDCAERELIEETGFKPGKLEKMLEITTSPGFCNEKIHLFLAKDLSPAFLACDEDEFIDLLSVDLDEALQMITAGDIKDSKTIIGLLNYKINCTSAPYKNL
ncbi:MAG: NUDIX hydrolase [Tissierellales bacterium]|nr:NUDIX hydrolase [Tissierellales bacterium]MBN2826896.1 NUDIX hydrolase [Tissierellales bacterium]